MKAGVKAVRLSEGRSEGSEAGVKAGVKAVRLSEGRSKGSEAE